LRRSRKLKRSDQVGTSRAFYGCLSPSEEREGGKKRGRILICQVKKKKKKWRFPFYNPKGKKGGPSRLSPKCKKAARHPPPPEKERGK